MSKQSLSQASAKLQSVNGLDHGDPCRYLHHMPVRAARISPRFKCFGQVQCRRALLQETILNLARGCWGCTPPSVQQKAAFCNHDCPGWLKRSLSELGSRKAEPFHPEMVLPQTSQCSPLLGSLDATVLSCLHLTPLENSLCSLRFGSASELESPRQLNLSRATATVKSVKLTMRL